MNSISHSELLQYRGPLGHPSYNNEYEPCHGLRMVFPSLVLPLKRKPWAAPLPPSGGERKRQRSHIMNNIRIINVIVRTIYWKQWIWKQRVTARMLINKVCKEKEIHMETVSMPGTVKQRRPDENDFWWLEKECPSFWKSLFSLHQH